MSCKVGFGLNVCFFMLCVFSSCLAFMLISGSVAQLGFIYSDGAAAATAAAAKQHSVADILVGGLGVVVVDYSREEMNE